MIARAIAGVLVCLLAGVTVCSAQPRRVATELPRRGTVEIGGGLLWAGGFDVESLPAQMTSNSGNNAPPVTLFNTETEVKGGSGLQVRAGVFITPTISVEGGVQYSRPVVAVRVSDDFEQAASLTAEQTMSRYVFQGSVLVHPRRWTLGARRRAGFFLIAGAGHVRELHEGNELLETGVAYHGGAGLKYWLTQGRRRLAFRGEALFVVRDGPYGSDTERRAHPALGATLSYIF